MSSMRCGLLLFPNLTQLDLTGPYEVLARIPGAEMHLLWKTRDPVRADTGLVILPTTCFADAPEVDLLLVPGGPGADALLTDRETLAFLRHAAPKARYLASVCTGALVLGAAGLLRGRRAATHWAAREHLAAFGAVAVDDRVVVDGTLYTGGGVTAGLDLALTIAAEVVGRSGAEAIQLGIEYAPHPPFDSGRPETARAEVLDRVRAATAARRKARREAVAAAARALAAES